MLVGMIMSSALRFSCLPARFGLLEARRHVLTG
jgi:hypothetical protein